MNAAAAAGIAIRRAEPADANLVADILAEAFADDPVMTWVMGARARALGLFRQMARRVYLARGFGHVMGEAAATLWLPPGESPQLSLRDEISIMGAVFNAGGFGALARGRRVGQAIAASHPPAPHYYLFAVGVRDAFRGKGLGGRVIRAGLQEADSSGAAAWLENSNPRNTPLYERLGFSGAAHLPLPAGAPPLLGMLRDGRTAA